MKILLSSKSLAICLNKLDLELSPMVRIVTDGDTLTFITGSQSSDLFGIHICGWVPMIKQHDRRWDWIKELVQKVSEQPIVLDIREEKVDVIFQY
jgi:hypothetical protein